MQTLSAVKHQQLMTKRWHDACAKWTPQSGGFPQLSMYGFHKNYGYVTFDLESHRSYWAKTKSESVESFKKRN